MSLLLTDNASPIYNPDLVALGEVNKKGKYNREKKEASYKKQKEASNNGNTHINNLYSA